MMPSRGVGALRGIVPWTRYAQHRSFSVAISTSRTRSAPIQHSRLKQNAPFDRLAVWSLCPTRFASTTATPIQSTPVPATELSSPPSNTSTVPDIDTLSLNDVDFSSPLAGVEKIGYLHELGIDYGWGITSMLQWTVEHFHIWGGLPWWGAIAATAIVLRVCTIPLTIRASDMSARSQALAPVMKPYEQRMKQAQKEGNSQKVMVEFQNMAAVRKQGGVSFTGMLGPVIVQAIAGYCGFRLMTRMASLPVPGLRDGGFLWLTDLTVPDGFLILPAIMAVTIHLLLRFGGEMGNSKLPGQMQKFMLWGMPVIVFFITGWQSAALAIWFTASGALSSITGLALRRPAVRKFLGITPFYQAPVEQQPEAQILGMPVPSASSASTAGSSTSAAGYMRPRYQAPTIRTTGGNTRTIDTTLASSSSQSTASAASPASQASQPGMFGSLKSSFAKMNATVTDYDKGRRNKATRKQRDAAIEKAVEERRNKAAR